MCWVGKKLDKHIAEKDIKVFKVLYGEDKTWKKLDPNYKPIYKSPFFFGAYTPGELHMVTLEIRDVGITMCSINRGFHSYSPKKCRWTKDSSGDYLTVIAKPTKCNPFEKRLQTFNVNISRNLRRKGGRPTFSTSLAFVKVLECIIPAGSIYYENENGEIVSNKLIANKELNI